MSEASGNTVKPANKRGTARLAAVQALYQMDVGGTSLTKVVVEYESERLGKEIDGHEYREADPSYFKAILAGVVADQKEIDPQIHQSLPNDWPLTRVDTTLRAILRCGVWELAERKDVPARVIINEYIDIAKAFFEVREPKLVNGVLNKVARDVRPDEFEQDASAQDETSSDD